MKIRRPLLQLETAFGPALRGSIDVAGKTYVTEADLGRTWLAIIDPVSSCQDSFVASSEGLVADSLNGVTDEWTAADIDAIDAIVAP